MINRNNKKMVDEYLVYKEKHGKLDHKSIRVERSISVHYLTWCGETDFAKAPSLNFTFVDYVEQLHRSQNYKRKLINSTKSFFEWISIHRKGLRLISPAWLHTFKFKTYPEEFDDENTISKDEIVLISKLPTESLLEQRVQAGTCFLYLSGMRVSAFTSMPIKAVDLQKLEVRQSPSLGMITKNKKSATTYILDIKEIFEIVRKWDTFVRSRLPADGYWFAPLLPTTGELDLNPAKANENRSNIFRKNLKKWLIRNQVTLRSPHAFRRGHANFLFDHAADISDLDAARENLMHDNLATTELYARKRRAQIKSRIQNMVHPIANSGENLDLHTKVSHVEEKVELLYQLLRSKNGN
jgi:site-specific recombinase XerD